jgi:hypothetical protein
MTVHTIDPEVDQYFRDVNAGIETANGCMDRGEWAKAAEWFDIVENLTIATDTPEHCGCEACVAPTVYDQDGDDLSGYVSDVPPPSFGFIGRWWDALLRWLGFRS